MRRLLALFRRAPKTTITVTERRTYAVQASIAGEVDAAIRFGDHDLLASVLNEAKMTERRITGIESGG